MEANLVPGGFLTDDLERAEWDYSPVALEQMDAIWEEAKQKGL